MTRPARTRRAARPATPEGAVLAGAKQLLDLFGFRWWRVNSGAVRDKTGRPVWAVTGWDGKRGFSDLIALAPRSARMIAIEIKRPGGKPTASQSEFLAGVRAEGGVALLIDDLAVLNRALAVLRDDPWARLDLRGGRIP